MLVSGRIGELELREADSQGFLVMGGLPGAPWVFRLWSRQVCDTLLKYNANVSAELQIRLNWLNWLNCVLNCVLKCFFLHLPVPDSNRSSVRISSSFDPSPFCLWSNSLSPLFFQVQTVSDSQWILKRRWFAPLAFHGKTWTLQQSFESCVLYLFHAPQG